MSGIKRPANVPDYQKHTSIMLDFFKRLISREPQLDEIHLVAAGTIYLGDSETDGSWRISRSGTDLHFDRRESGSWVNKGSHTA
jgi:hypothetical protein